MFIFIDKVGLRRLKKDQKPNQKRDLSLSLSPSSPRNSNWHSSQMSNGIEWKIPFRISDNERKILTHGYCTASDPHNITLIRKQFCNILRNSSLISRVESNYIMSTQLWQKYHCKNVPTRELYLSFVVKTVVFQLSQKKSYFLI